MKNVKILKKGRFMDARFDQRNNVIEYGGTASSIFSFSFTAPVSGTVYGVRLNSKRMRAAFAEKMTAPPYHTPPKRPIFYLRPGNTITSHLMEIPCPEESPVLDLGPSLGVVIGKTAFRVKKEKALDYVFGYTIGNDLSIPHDDLYRPAFRQLMRDGFCPLGPWVIDNKDIGEGPFAIRVAVNGKIVQMADTQDYKYSVNELIAELSTFVALRPGDVVLTGAPDIPPQAACGDRVRVEIEGIGYLENTLVPEGADA